MTVEYKVLLNESGRKYPHYWEMCVGSCHAITILREDNREMIRRAQKECGFKYLRFHGLFDDVMNVVINPMFGMGEPKISFYNIDCIFDFLLEIGMKPFIEIGFMPEALASGTQTCFNYKANVTMPKEMTQWNNLIKLFTEHLIERYGLEEVQQWFFEVWNEPNLNFFFDGTQEDYFSLYENTARTIKEVESTLKVGGPATSVNAWITPFIDFCESKNVPLDFVSTHHYPSDDPLSSMGMNGPGTKGKMFDEETIEKFKNMSKEAMQEMVAGMFSRESKNPRNILSEMTKKAKEEAKDYPLYYTEWNGARDFDKSYQAAFVIQTFAENEDLVEGYSYWTVTDIFEEMGLHPEPFHNEFGLQTKHGVKKPAYHIFEQLHSSGDERLNVEGSHRTAELFVLKKDKTVTIFAYNHDIESRDIKSEDLSITLDGNVKNVKKAVIDSENCNPLKLWEEMGSPLYLKSDDVEKLKEESTIIYKDVNFDNNIVKFTALPESVTILKVELN